MNLTIAEIADLCGGELSLNSDSQFLINQVVINSNDVADNTLFVAIPGYIRDGHAFVYEVVTQRKCAALVSKTRLAMLDNISELMQLANLIFVDDTAIALGRLASNYRKKFTIPLVGITGSNGKTTVKEMLKQICIYQFGEQHILATEGNYNNHLGMPLTLLKLNQTHKVAIIEMGMNHAGELNYLTNLAHPTIAVVNNVNLAHAGFFNHIEDIAAAKAEIYHGLVAEGVACINMAEPLYPVFEENIAPRVKRFYYGGADSKCYLAPNSTAGLMGVITDKGKLEIKLQLLGEHNQKNALTAIALALNLGCSLENISAGLNNYTGFARRLERKTAFNGALLIDDSYNANPASTRAAILAISDLPKPHWLILADRRELGKFGAAEHEAIGKFAETHGIDCLLTVGELAAVANTAFSGNKLHFASNHDVVKYCLDNLPKTATLLIKGSLSTNLKEVVSNLLA